MSQNKSPELRWISHPFLPILVVLLVNLILGVIFVADYGESWDEDRRIRVANKSLEAYQGIDRNLEDEKGPFYIMAARLGSDVLVRLDNNWQMINAWHFMIFLSFLIAIFFFYVLCLQFVNPMAALVATLLFNTQPLLWGHAFINPKDIPFMAFFVASVASGLVMVKRFEPGNPTNQPREQHLGLMERMRADWQAKSRRSGVIFALLSLGWLTILVFILLVNSAINRWIASVVRIAYGATPISWPARLFSLVLGNARVNPVDQYISSFQTLSTIFWVVVLFLTLLIILMTGLFPTTLRWLWSRFIRPIFSQTGHALANGWLVLAAVLLGFSSAIRVLGPFAGAMIAGYFLWKFRRKAIIPLAVYFAIGFLVTYFCWPYLWGAPIAKYLGSFNAASDYPNGSLILFAGQIYEHAPLAYFPVLLVIQIGGTALLAVIFGIGTAFARWISHSIDRSKIVLLLVWFLLPPAVGMVLNSTMYDNFRQFLFVMPPLFVFAALGFEFIFLKVRLAWVNALIVMVIILPNLLAIINLHPYEYTYYNLLVGGTQGAFRQFETDYWATSYHEVADYINRNVPASSRVIVWGPYDLVRKYVSPSIRVVPYIDGQSAAELQGDYLVISSRENADLKFFPQQPDIFTVGRDGAIFSVLRQIPLQ